MQEAWLFLILPPTVGLAYCAIAYAWEVKSPTGKLGEYWLPLTVFGIIFLLFGVYGYQSTHNWYGWDVDLATNYRAPQIIPLLADIYRMVWASDILWISAGILFLTSPILKIVLHTKRNIKAPA